MRRAKPTSTSARVEPATSRSAYTRHSRLGAYRCSLGTCRCRLRGWCHGASAWCAKRRPKGLSPLPCASGARVRSSRGSVTVRGCTSATSHTLPAMLLRITWWTDCSSVRQPRGITAGSALPPPAYIGVISLLISDAYLNLTVGALGGGRKLSRHPATNRIRLSALGSDSRGDSEAGEERLPAVAGVNCVRVPRVLGGQRPQRRHDPAPQQLDAAQRGCPRAAE